MKIVSVAVISLPLMFTPGIIAQQAPPLQLNAPYQCANNTVVIVKNCRIQNGAEVCSLVKGPAKGPLGDEITLPKAQAAAIGLICTPPAGNSAPAKGPSATSPGATNPAYLSEMPAPARILAEIKGKDAEDTAERQMGAFEALKKMMDDMAWGLGHRYVNDADTRALTPDERRIRLGYQTAYADLWHKVTNKEGHVYDHDPALRNELLAKFFSENFRAQYFQSDRNAAAGYRAFQERMYGSSANAQPTLRANQSSSTSNPGDNGPVRASGAPDPSIAKARAANVDTKVLGLPLGESVQVPVCDSMFESKTCLQEEPPAELVDTISSIFSIKNTAEDTRSSGRAVRLSADDCPSWMSDCYARLLLYDGRLVAVDISTKGHTVDQVVARELREKYGPPTLTKHIAVTPRVGNAFNANDLEWNLPGLHVVYDVVTKGAAEGEITNTEVGNIGIETEAAYQRRMRKQTQKPKPKL
jgi:hypothetical protein